MRFQIVFYLIVCTFISLNAQAPQSFSYQAVARNAAGEVLSNQDIGIRFSISRDQGPNDGTGLVVYKEQHETTTNQFGLFTLNIGEGTPLFEAFLDIDWGAGKYFVRTELDATGTNNYEPLGISPILSVPYALHAATADNIDDADADPFNELQVLFYNPLNRQLFISEGNMVDLSDVDDADADPANEIQVLNFNPNNFTLSLSNGNTVDLSALQTTGGMNVNQNLSLNGTVLGITGGNTLDLGVLLDGVNDADADPSNEIQNLSFDTSSNLLSISTGNQVDLSSLRTVISSGDDLDEQTLQLNGTSLSIENGNTVDLSVLPDLVNDADADPNNEIQSLDYSPTTNTLTISGGNTIVLNSGSNSGGDDSSPFERVDKTIRNRVNDAQLDFLFGSNFIDFNGDSLSGRRIIFSGEQGAFRAGGNFEAGLDYRKSQFGDYSTWWDRSFLGAFSFAGGFSNLAGGAYSTAFGRLNIAVGTGSFTAGLQNEVLGDGSFAMGRDNTVNGNMASALGEGLVNNSFGEMVVGLYNSISENADPDDIISSDPIFTVGNGSRENQRSNAFEILKNGSARLNGRLTLSNPSDPIKRYTFPNEKGDPGEVLLSNNQQILAWGLPAGIESLQGNTRLRAFDDTDSGLELTLKGTPRFLFIDGRMEFLNSDQNVIIGNDIALNISGGQKNVLIGDDVATSLADGSENVLIGSGAGFSMSTADNNVAIGSNAGLNHRNGMKNVFIGNDAGFGNTDGDHNVFIGNNAGKNEFTSNKLVIEGLDGNTFRSLIVGDFLEDWLNFNAQVGINKATPESTLHIVQPDSSGRAGLRLENNGSNGNFWNLSVNNGDGALLLFSDQVGTDASNFIGRFDPVTGIYSAPSDARMKKNISTLPAVMDKLKNLPIYRYQYLNHTDSDPYSLGILAQDLMPVFPELTYYDQNSDRFSVNYSGFGVLALKAIQEQQGDIENLKDENKALRSELEEMKAMLLSIQKQLQDKQ